MSYLKDAIPMGSASKTITSSGSIAPDSIRNLSVSDMGLPTSPGPLRNTRYGSISLPCFKPSYDCLNFCTNYELRCLVLSSLSTCLYCSVGISCLLVALSNRTYKLAVVVDVTYHMILFTDPLQDRGKKSIPQGMQ